MLLSLLSEVPFPLSLLAQPSPEFDRVTEDPRETVNIVDFGSPLDVTKKPNVCAQMNSYGYSDSG